jgi:hypothetical protein
MKSHMLTALLSLTLAFCLNSASSVAAPLDDAQAAAANAETSFAARDFDAAGIQHAKDAAAAYEQLANSSSLDEQTRAQYAVKSAEAYYFVGSANTSDDAKLAFHAKGMAVADQALKFFKITDTTKLTDADAARFLGLAADQKALLAEALYQKGTNLGQWGSANGITSSIGKWPELRGDMEFIVKLKQKDIHDFGPLRVLGWAYFKLPGILGGDNSKSEKLLSTAVNSTLAKDASGAALNFSVNAANNTFYAQLLQDIDKTPQAKVVLKGFISADPATLKPGSEAETKHGQQEARDLLKKWN